MLQVRRFISYNDLKFNLLKRELIVNQAEQFEHTHIGDMQAAQFDPRSFAGKLGMSVRHFTVEQKRNVGVEPFLQTKQLLVRTVPLIRLLHDQDHLVRFRIVRDHVDHACSILAT